MSYCINFMPGSGTKNLSLKGLSVQRCKACLFGFVRKCLTYLIIRVRLPFLLKKTPPSGNRKKWPKFGISWFPTLA